MNAIYIGMFIIGMAMMVMASSVRTLVIDRSEDPFLDPYLEKVLNTNVKDLVVMPKMSDEEFVRYLYRNDRFVKRSTTSNAANSVFDPLRDNQLIYNSEINKEWETLMIAGPIVVGYMSNLMVLSSKQDFPFKAKLGYTYQYIKYPDSFRATLVQTSNEMYNALMGAHTGMDKIQLAIKQVPTHVKTVMKLISSASDNMLKSMLPRTLESIGRLATESANIANSTLLRFVHLQDLLGEIIELSSHTQSVNEADIERMREQKENGTLEEKRISTKLDLIKSQYSESRAKLETARKDYAQQMRTLKAATSSDMESEGNPLGNLIQGALDIVNKPIATIGNVLNNIFCGTRKVDNTKFENALKLAEIAKQSLQEAEKEHDKYFFLQLEEQNELFKVINQMALLDMNTLNTKEIVRLLLEATEQIYEIRKQWERMIEFFSKLAAQAYSTQQVVVYDFVAYIQDAQKDNLLVDPIDREFFVELLIPAATTIENGAHILYIMSTTYYAISSEYMINQIAGIGKMTLLTNEVERSTQLKLVSNNTMETSLKISQLAQEKHESYIQSTHARQAEYTVYIDNLKKFEITE